MEDAMIINKSAYERGFGCENMSKNLIRTLKNGEIYFKNHKVICPRCKAHKINDDGYYKRILNFFPYWGKNMFYKNI